MIRVLLAAHIGEPFGGIATNYENLLASSLRSRVNLHFVETSDPRRSFSAGGTMSLNNLLGTLKRIAWFVYALVLSRPNVVHIATSFGLSMLKHSMMVLIARLIRIPVILSPHCSLSAFLPAENTAFRRYILFVLRQCRALAVISSEWTAISSLLPKSRVVLIPNAIRLDSYLELPRPRGGNSQVRIVYLGHLGAEKGTFDLVRTATLLKARHLDFSMQLVGESLRPGEAERALKMVRDLDLDGAVSVMGPEFGQEKVKRLGSADIFVLPSYSEGAPISVIEAMASGLAVVASAVGGIPEMIQDKQQGLLVDPGKPDQIAEALARLINDGPLRLKLGCEARQAARGAFSVEDRVKDLVALYEWTAAQR